jgi:cyclopropane fatty-acyl-phospholipid synthase-like methyltransferase
LKTSDYYSVKDACREGLLLFLHQAVAQISLPTDPLILDIGCGTGVPTLAISSRFRGTIHAVDPDPESIARLDRKIKEQNLPGRIFTRCATLESITFAEKSLDLILAEGLLNVVGFEYGISILSPWIRQGGYLVIHDENDRHEEKMTFLENAGFMLLNSLFLDSRIWWDHYYACLEQRISESEHPDKRWIFAGELNEIAQYRKDPGMFRSVYYVLRKTHE